MNKETYNNNQIQQIYVLTQQGGLASIIFECHSVSYGRLLYLDIWNIVILYY